MKVDQQVWTAGDGWRNTVGTGVGTGAHLVLLFGARAQLQDPAAFQQVRARYPQAVILGCSTAGEICGTQVRDGSMVATAVAFEHTRVQLAQEVDRQLFVSAVANLVQNAFKFTRARGHVSLRTRTSAGRVVIAVEDECGGLPPGRAEELFRPFEQRGTNRSGLGLGLSISLQSVQANGGDISVHNLPGKGCIFSIGLPLAPEPPPAS